MILARSSFLRPLFPVAKWLALFLASLLLGRALAYWHVRHAFAEQEVPAVDLGPVDLKEPSYTQLVGELRRRSPTPIDVHSDFLKSAQADEVAVGFICHLEHCTLERLARVIQSQQTRLSILPQRGRLEIIDRDDKAGAAYFRIYESWLDVPDVWRHDSLHFYTGLVSELPSRNGLQLLHEGSYYQHRQLQSYLQLFNRLGQTPHRSVHVRPLSNPDEMLDAPMPAVDFRGMTLREAVEAIEPYCQSRLIVDWGNLAEWTAIRPTTRCDCVLPESHVGTVLVQLFHHPVADEDLHELGGVIVLHASRNVNSPPAETRFYRVDDPKACAKLASLLAPEVFVQCWPGWLVCSARPTRSFLTERILRGD